VIQITARRGPSGKHCGRRALMLARTDLMFALVVLLGLATTVLTFS
jgi:hypothetical protein